MQITMKEELNLLAFFQRSKQDIPEGIGKYFRQILLYWSEMYFNPLQEKDDVYRQVL